MPAAAVEIPEALAALLGEDYEDLAPLGEDGGLSRLFRARKRGLDIDVVIKRMKLNPNSPINEKQEARVLTSLRHQYLPRIFDFKTDGADYCYTIMELIPGCTLRQYVDHHGALDQKTALFWMKQLCQVTKYMHSQHPPIIHSDIKPENIMVTPEGNLCLIDFNASLELRDDGVAAVAATMCYAAPEQYNVPLKNFPPPEQLSSQRRAVYDMAAAAQGMGRVTERTDLYAIGAVTYFMLTGYDPPCWNASPVPLSRYDIVLSDPLCQTVERCMELHAERRFASARELERALNNLARLDQRYRAWRRSCQIAAGVVGAGVLLSISCTVWGWMTMRRQTGQEYNDLIAQAQRLDAQMDYAGEEELLFQAVRLEQTRPEAYANLAGLLYRQGEYQQAIDLLSDLELDGGTLDDEQALAAQGQIQYVLANSHYQMENYRQALTCYQTAALFCPEEAAYCRDLAVCYAKLGYAEQAQAAVELLSELDCQPGDSELAAGEIAYAAGRFEDGVGLLEQAMQLSSDHTVISRASLQSAQCCQQLGSGWIQKEIELLENAVNRLNTAENGVQLEAMAEALFRLASARPEEREACYKQALVCLEELMNRGNPTFAVRQNAALALEYLDRFQEAENILIELEADYPRDYRPPMRLALLYADWQSISGQDESQRFVEQYELAQSLYSSASLPDSDMEYLRELAGRYQSTQGGEH